jgi:membrane dipeptidase
MKENNYQQRCVIALAMLASLLAAPFVFATESTKLTDQQIQALHDRITTVDTHVDIPRNYATALIDATQASRLNVDLPKMQSGGLDAAFFIVYVDQSYRNEWEYDAVKKAALTKFKAIHRMSKNSNDQIDLAATVASAKKSIADNRQVAFIGVENGFSIGREIGLLEQYFELGARYMGLVHNGHNDIGDSASPSSRFGDKPSEHGGLSPFGREVVREMNRLGMMVDVSHASKQTMIDATHHSKSPVIASHSSVRALVDHPRNLDDEQLMLIKEKGGVVQVTAVDMFLVDRSNETSSAIDKVRTELGLTDEYMHLVVSEAMFKQYQYRLKHEVAVKYPRANVKHLIDHVDYIVNKIGVEHVGISSDFDGGGGIIGWADASETPNITREMVKRGYSESDIKKIWGGNLLRVLRENEKIAERLNKK